MKIALKTLFLLLTTTLLAQEVAVPAKNVELKGTLLVAGKKDVVALIIAGSGPTDRNGNSGMNLKTDAYKKMADALAARGISSLRFDKRWIGESKPEGINLADVVLEDYIEDASALVDYLSKSGFKKIVLVGHSEGSLVALGTAVKNTKVAGVISVAGAGKPVNEVIIDQLTAQSEEFGKMAKITMDSVVAGHSPKRIHPMLYSMFNPDIQPFMRSYARNDPAKLAATIKQPLMIVQGTTDIQVGVEHAEMLKNANPKAQLKLYEGMNHILVEAPADRMANIATYYKPELPLFAGLMEDISTFILTLK
jgi:uncharacterized protein